MAGPQTEAERKARQMYFLAGLARREGVVRALEERAGAAAGRPERCLAWMGVQRQAERYLREVRVSSSTRRLQPLSAELALHRHALEKMAAGARSEVEAVDGPTRAAARHRLGLRLAVVGKGGAGKTMLCATLARMLARRGRKVLAADLDTNPGLAYSLGLGPHADGVPLSVEEDPAGTYGWRLAERVAPHEAVERFAVRAPDGVRFLSLGKIGPSETTKPKQTVSAVRQILDQFGEPDWDVVGDMEAGPTTPFERYHCFADRVVVVVGPAWRSALTARRLLPILGDVPVVMVANRFGDEPDHPGLEPVIRVPFDPDAAEAERRGIAPIDHCPDSPAVEAIEQLAELFLPQEVSL